MHPALHHGIQYPTQAGSIRNGRSHLKSHSVSAVNLAQSSNSTTQGSEASIPRRKGAAHRKNLTTGVLMDHSPYTAVDRSISPHSSLERLSRTSSSSSGHNASSHLGHVYTLSADPRDWGTDLYLDAQEADDHIHNPSPVNEKHPLDPLALHGKGFNSSSSGFSKGKQRSCRPWDIMNRRGLANVGGMALLLLAILGLFAVYPVVIAIRNGAFGRSSIVRGVNGTGQVPVLGNWGLIDQDTPQEVRTIASYHNPDGPRLQLVFSDEFNQDGRSFYPGDDPYFEAENLHYWGTNDLEWYDPSAVTTRNGSLAITMSQADPELNYNLSYKSGMLTSWNKFCFTGGLIQASVMLPGAHNVIGLWPAVWTMGNLGRAGYGATLDGTWPYSYDSCDVGTLPNQTLNGFPEAATNSGFNEGPLSFLPGQRLSRCTCPGESHPGPTHDDGTFVGRSAPEIDIIEAQTTRREGSVSQSGQWGPFDFGYEWKNTSDVVTIYDADVSKLNTYRGAVYQEAASVVTQTNQDCYELGTGCFSVYGFEYKPGFNDAYITWISDGAPSWTLLSGAMGPDERVNISARSVSQEPMYIIMNLGMSFGFTNNVIDFDHLQFPATMLVDYIRVYQEPDALNIGCDPEGFPTADYINA
ncbi:hypothetical protein D9758_003386 [Tetrapyrgos nigripes]|uniref:GH16 domain-containing protein n=1 Tax=Tetrapyrgos nigripes TaxID=182062 RepID=A0A8H5GVR1_9AGAR|nr:hypothetical protein D9758_003386 [Tetrapyrgos nigripes]